MVSYINPFLPEIAFGQGVHHSHGKAARTRKDTECRAQNCLSFLASLGCGNMFPNHLLEWAPRRAHHSTEHAVSGGWKACESPDNTSWVACELIPPWHDLPGAPHPAATGQGLSPERSPNIGDSHQRHSTSPVLLNPVD